MTVERSKQMLALEKAKQVLLNADMERKKKFIYHLVQQFTSGRKELLKKDDFAADIGPYLYLLYQQGDRTKILKIVPMLGICALDDESKLRENAVKAISKLASLLIESNDPEVFLTLFETLTDWFKQETSFIDGYAFACRQLNSITQKLLANQKYWQEVEGLLIHLHSVQTGIVEKNRSLREVSSKLLESIATKSILDRLIRSYLSIGEAESQLAERLLSHLGRRAVICLLNALMHSENKEERLLLIKLIPESATDVVPVLIECLEKRPPWYIIRNVIFIISELNNPELYHLVSPYLSHKDIRVQQQALSCITKISDKNLKSRMFKALPLVDDRLKMQIIMQFGQTAGENASEALLDLLNARNTFHAETSTELLVKICIALKYSPSEKTIPALDTLIEERQSYGSTDPVTRAARDTLLFLKPRYRRSSQPSYKEHDQLEIADHAPITASRADSMEQLEHQVMTLISQGEIERAGKKLFDSAVAAAQDKDFSTAELLRDKLIEINPLALSEVIRLGEIIDEEKDTSISNHHIAVWSELYEKMSTDEFNALYYAMRQESYRRHEDIIKIGETEPSLFFLNTGFVSLTCPTGTRNTFLKKLQPGEVIGVGQFFSVSVWTISMTAQTETQMNVLSREKFKPLQDDFPELESKLHEFCMQYDTIPELLKMAGSDRREFPRYSVSVIINNMLLDPYGNTGKRKFKGEMVDISKGGLCFSIQISSRENARLLLGRQIITEITLINGDILKCFGTIVGVKFSEISTRIFTVHVKFYHTLEQENVNQVLNLEI